MNNFPKILVAISQDWDVAFLFSSIVVVRYIPSVKDSLLEWPRMDDLVAVDAPTLCIM